MNNRQALVLGASGGIGKVVLAAIRDAGIPAIGQRRSADIKDMPFCDLQYEHLIQGLIQDVQPDILVHCAGINIDGMSWKMSLDKYEQVQMINATSAWLAAKYAIPKMRDQNWGRIIFMSSVLAKESIPGTIAYTVSKASIEAMVRVIAREANETGSDGITVNAIAPGYLNCGIGNLPGPIKEKCEARIPMGRFGEPEDVASCVLWLINSPYVTGEVIRIDGGM